MSHREEAISRILDEGADLTEENITAEVSILEAETPKPDPNEGVIRELQDVKASIDQLIEVVSAQSAREIKIPEIKIPTINVPPANITVPGTSGDKFKMDITRDASGAIINVTATKE